jgi:phosphonoacetaldehyde hydrolase
MNPNSRSKHRFKGKVTTIIGDWTGTFVDAGSLSVKDAIKITFNMYGIRIDNKVAAAPTGSRTDQHVRMVMETPSVKNDWFVNYKRFPTENDIKEVYDKLVDVQLNILQNYTKIIPGSDVMMRQLREDYGIKFGLTTGFIKSMSDIVNRSAKYQGLEFDSVVAGDEVDYGSRPYPFMLYKNLNNLGVENIRSVIKVDDTEVGIKEAIAAGCWSVGVSRWSTYTEYDSLDHLARATPAEKDKKSNTAKTILLNAGANFVIEDVTMLPDIVDMINSLIKHGVHPSEL